MQSSAPRVTGLQCSRGICPHSAGNWCPVFVVSAVILSQWWADNNPHNTGSRLRHRTPQVPGLRKILAWRQWESRVITRAVNEPSRRLEIGMPMHLCMGVLISHLLTVFRSLLKHSVWTLSSGLIVKALVGTFNTHWDRQMRCGHGCLLDEPASQWEERIYIPTFATHLPISVWTRRRPY